MIFLLENLFVPIRDFFELGGGVLYGILAATILMWTLIVERIWFYYFILPQKLRSRRIRHAVSAPPAPVIV